MRRPHGRAAFSREKLAEIERVVDKPWTLVTLENANHDLIEGGSICQVEGPLADVLSPLREWTRGLFRG